MNLEGAVPAHKPGVSLPITILSPTLSPPTFTLCTPSPDNLLHPEWFQGWDPGVLILRHQLHAPDPVRRREYAKVTKAPTLRLWSHFLLYHASGPQLSPLTKLTGFLKPESSASQKHPVSSQALCLDTVSTQNNQSPSTKSLSNYTCLFSQERTSSHREHPLTPLEPFSRASQPLGLHPRTPLNILT